MSVGFGRCVAKRTDPEALGYCAMNTMVTRVRAVPTTTIDDGRFDPETLNLLQAEFEGDRPSRPMPRSRPWRAWWCGSTWPWSASTPRSMPFPARRQGCAAILETTG